MLQKTDLFTKLLSIHMIFKMWLHQKYFRHYTKLVWYLETLKKIDIILVYIYCKFIIIIIFIW